MTTTTETLTPQATLVTPTEVLIVGPQALNDWRNEQRLPVPGHVFMPRFKHGRWDGHHTPGKWCRQRGDGLWELRCSRGLLGRLAATFPDITLAGLPRSMPPELFEAWLATHPTLHTLRDYQQEAFQESIRRRWGRVALATNAGKGAVIALIADFGRAHNLPTLILCDELSVFDALLGEIAEWTNITPGIVGQGVQLPPTDPVVLAMVPTLARRISGKDDKAKLWRAWVGQRAVLLLDEADKATAPTWRRIIYNAVGSHWRVGFSGTFPSPAKDPYADLCLDELMGPIFIHATNLDMVKRGVSARPDVALHGFNVTDTIIPHPIKGWWGLRGAAKRQWVYEQAIIHNPVRHAYIATLIRPDTPTAIVVNRIDHGHALTDTLPQAVFLDGSADTTKRHEVLEAFQEGEIHVLVVTKILDRGTNRLGHTTDLIFASGEGSNRQTLQRIGRGLRRTGGKEFLRLVDVIDRIEVKNSDSNYRKQVARYLHAASRNRIRLYRDEGFDINIIT